MPRLSRREFLGATGLAAAGIVTSCGRTAPGPETVTSTGTEWGDLAGALRGTVIRPGDTRFRDLADPRNQRYSTLMPEAVVLCSGADDVATSVSWARKTNTPFAIRGGGHNYSSASSSRGIIISTRRMNSAAIDGTRLRAQAGVLNADLAGLLAKDESSRLVLPGGTCPAVGVAGLTLGGGIGPNAPWAGLTADRLRAATMVTAEGAVVTASATENPDLFWGLRGGAGGNFGVLTEMEFDLAEVPVSRATTATLMYRGFDAALAAGVEFQRLRAAAERTATGNLHFPSREGDVDARLKVQALADEATARDLLRPLLAIPGVEVEIAERSWWDAYRWYTTKPIAAYSFWDRSLYADEFLTEDTLGEALTVVRRFPGETSADSDGAMGLYGWVGGAVADVAPADTAYAHRAARVLVEMASSWPTPANPGPSPSPVPPEIRAWSEELWATLLPHTTGGSYQNFPDPELEQWAPGYYRDNLSRLIDVKSAWDPDDVFTHFQGIPATR